MRGLMKIIVGNPIVTILMVVFMGVAGIYSALHMSVDLFPNMDIPVVNIITHYAEVSPEDMERLVTRPIEDEIRGIPGVKRVASTSVQGISQVTAEFSWGTSVRDARQMVQARLSRLSGVLPTAVTPRLENIGTTLQEVCGYVIYGGSDLVTLRNTVKYDLTGRLMSVEGVSSVEVIGGDKRAFVVELRTGALKRAKIAVGDVVLALRRCNVAAVAGYLDQSGREYLIRGDARLRSIADLRSLPVGDDSACNPILLGDIADIRESSAPRHYIVNGDGQASVALIIRKQPGASTIAVATGVDAAMRDLKNLLPSNSKIKKFYDQSEIIKESRNEILSDIAVGAILAVLILYFFLGSLRPTLIVAATIPVTVLATLAVMRYCGMTLNVITMTALALGVGMIVDDAIVVAENIFRKARNSHDPQTASIEGALEIAGPDASGTITTVVAFLPLLLMTGIAALFLRPFGMTISVALLVSFLLSLTFIPTLLGRSKTLSVERDDFLGARLLKRLDSMLQSVLRFSFSRRWLVLSVAGLFLGLASLTAFLGKSSILPPIDEGAILIEYVMPPGTSLRESDRIGNLIDQTALKNSDVSCVYRRTGSPGDGYQIEGVDKGELMIKLKPKNAGRHNVDEIIDSLRKSYSKIESVVFLYHQPTQEKIDESFSGLPALFGVTVYGSDISELISIAGRVEDIMAKNPAVANIVNNTKIETEQINVKLDYPALAKFGIDAPNVLNTLKAAKLGIEATRIVRQKEVVSVLVRLKTSNGNSVGDLRKLPITFKNGEWVPLERLAEITVTRSPATVTRLNGQRQITLLAEVDGDLFAVIKELRGKFKSIAWPKGYSIDFTGQYHVLARLAIEMIFAIIAAMALIYLIIAMQFSSWTQPLVVLITVPLSLVGALIGLFVTGHGLDVSVGMGAVTLVGVSVNNAIVLIDFSNKEKASGKSTPEALLSAASVRLRPILLSSLTTVAALIPTAICAGTGSRIFQPFAVTVIGGLLVGILATLIVVPTILASKQNI
ncbi:MAG: efflux RND transporter permease subunit [Kiritimatiellaeota bacterium]|nr:efflux RND transporter permease subunit [Kiritimatiellota bacterium]